MSRCHKTAICAVETTDHGSRPVLGFVEWRLEIAFGQLWKHRFADGSLSWLRLSRPIATIAYRHHAVDSGIALIQYSERRQTSLFGNAPTGRSTIQTRGFGAGCETCIIGGEAASPSKQRSSGSREDCDFLNFCQHGGVRAAPTTRPPPEKYCRITTRRNSPMFGPYQQSHHLIKLFRHYGIEQGAETA